MIPTSYDNLSWADQSLVQLPNWIEYQVVPNLGYGRGVLPGYGDGGYGITEGGFPEMLQPAPTSPTYGLNSQPAVSSINIPTEQEEVSKAEWGDVHEGFGLNSTTLDASASVLGDLMGNMNRSRQASQLAYGLERQADAYMSQAESSYKIAGVNMMRMRSNQGRYLSQQRVSGVRTGFAPTSGSIEAVQKATMSAFDRQIADAEREAEQRRQNTVYRGRVASWKAAQAKKAAKGGELGMLGSIVGGTIGAVFGGPAGMAIGSKIGSSLGGFA